MNIRGLLSGILITFLFAIAANGQVVPADSLRDGEPVYLSDTLTPPSDTVPATSGGKSILKGPSTPDSLTVDTTSAGKTVIKTETGTIVTTDQDDMEEKKKEKARRKKKRMVQVGDKEPHDPKKAVRRSAIIPGWGQVYNGSAWKVPIIYAGFGTFTGFFIYWNGQYRTSRDLYICALDPNCSTGDDFRDPETYRSDREFYRRYRDLQVILGAVWYTLNLVDAMVEAHLKDFDVSDDLSMKIKPALQFDPMHNRMVVGGGITLKLKK